MPDPFITDVENLLLIHREDHPLCDDCKRLYNNYPKWRRHVAEVIAAARTRHAKAPATVMDVFVAHAPYIRRDPIRLQCNECLDGGGAGEFCDTLTWAEHMVAALHNAGLKVTSRAAITKSVSTADLFDTHPKEGE